MPAAAITPATARIHGAPLISLEARRYAATRERKPPARAVITHRVGAPAVHTPYGAMNSTGNGFHDGPPRLGGWSLGERAALHSALSWPTGDSAAAWRSRESRRRRSASFPHRWNGLGSGPELRRFARPAARAAP